MEAWKPLDLRMPEFRPEFGRLACVRLEPPLNSIEPMRYLVGRFDRPKSIVWFEDEITRQKAAVWRQQGFDVCWCYLPERNA